MTTLITGGGSRNGVALARLLEASGRKVIFASRSGNRIPEGFRSVKLDWLDPSTLEAPFAYADEAGETIRFVFLLCPDSISDPLPVFKPFIDLALKRGVQRFVLLSAGQAILERGPESAMMGIVHTYLGKEGIDYFAVRPTWFAENFVQIYGKEIKEKSTIQTVVPTGKVPFVAIEDIARVAYDAIVNIEKFLPAREGIVVGPELVSYDEAAAILSEVLGRKINHHPVDEEYMVKKYMLPSEEGGFDIPEDVSRELVKLEKTIEAGDEAALVHDPRAVFGKVGIREWIKKHKDELL